MKSSKFKIHLGIWFILAVVVPSFLLGILAIRTVAREEAFLEKRLQDTLSAETSHTASAVTGLLAAAKEELNRTLTFRPQQTDQAFQVSLWKKSSDLVDIPFLLSPNRELLWPSEVAQVSASEKFFIRWSLDFFKDLEATPVYQNIALAYKDKIIEEAPRYQTTSWGDSSDQQAMQQKSSSPKLASRSRAQKSDAIGEQYSASQFAQYEPLQKEVYSEATQKGQTVSKRNIYPQKSAGQQAQARMEPEESIFISESLKFSQIVSKSDSGIIPFIIKEKLRLLFWKKDGSGHIYGCLLNQESLVERIVRALPPIYSETRVLTVLDENGKPLITPDQKNPIDWHRPFAAAEISEILPRWEVAAYLTDPRAISSKARATEVLTWVLISILLVSIVTGGALVLRSLDSEIRLAQQKTTFAATVSHELKTPLTSIRMFTEMLKEGRQPDENKRRQYLDIMLSESERLTRLINNVLDFSLTGRKQKTYRFKEVDIVELCRSVFEGQRVRLEYIGFQMTFAGAAIGLRVKADEEALRQVLLNLLSNAEKYSGENKEIDIEIVKKDGSVLINVMDRGIGIPAAHARRIFEEFYRVDDSLTAKTRGTGLGLTIAQSIARDHGGEILCIPRDGGGSIFQVKLPCLEASQ
ncbi:MAG: HAMP domain-containing sensor histidine kinase [Candidatus Omnitrophota bacterium]|nr:HAMP domain-containing sensor histidine kinase [Candidatus Omnitrophota bacterium]MDZ4242225.1 HAMP domain-containing sensor histidine kinase [Candidatus Omnitrophota bacterium]